MEIMCLSLDVEPLPHEGFRPGELRMNDEQRKKKTTRLDQPKNTANGATRHISHTERKASKQIPCSSCCSLPSLSHTSLKPRTTAVGELALPPFLRAPRWRKESSNPAQIPPLRARFWPREPRIDCSSIIAAKWFGLPTTNQPRPRRGSRVHLSFL